MTGCNCKSDRWDFQQKWKHHEYWVNPTNRWRNKSAIITCKRYMLYPEVKKGALDKLNAPKFSAWGELSSFRFLGTKQFSNWKQESHYLKKISKVFNCSPHDFMTTCSFCGGASWSFTDPSVGIKHSAPCRLRPINITKPRFCKDLYNRLV